MRKLNSVLNQPWRTTCKNCGSYELYINSNISICIADADEQEIKESDIELECDKCSHSSGIVYDKKQNKNTHVKSILL